FWSVMVKEGDAHEVRVPDPRKGGPARLYGVHGGYYNDGDAMVRDVSRITGNDAEAVYITLNPVKPALLARAYNTFKGLGTTTGDADIKSRRRFLIDVDAVRPSGISSTDEEVAAA